MRQTHRITGALLALITLGAASPGTAAEVRIELNRAEAQADGPSCKLSFLVTNAAASDISAAVFEIVLLTTAGEVERLTLFDFGSLPSGRPRVRQFQVDGLACDTLGEVLLNGWSQCDGPADACTAPPDLETRLDIGLIGG